MNRMAKIQLQELQIAVGAVPDGTPKKSAEKSKKGIGSLFRRTKSDPIPNSPTFAASRVNTSEPLPSRRRSPPNDRYSVPKSESMLGRLRKQNNKAVDSDNGHLDPALQEAIASSLSSKPRTLNDNTEDDWDNSELEHALALSLSEQAISLFDTGVATNGLEMGKNNHDQDKYHQKISNNALHCDDDYVNSIRQTMGNRKPRSRTNRAASQVNESEDAELQHALKLSLLDLDEDFVSKSRREAETKEKYMGTDDLNYLHCDDDYLDPGHPNTRSFKNHMTMVPVEETSEDDDLRHTLPLSMLDGKQCPISGNDKRWGSKYKSQKSVSSNDDDRFDTDIICSNSFLNTMSCKRRAAAVSAGSDRLDTELQSEFILKSLDSKDVGIHSKPRSESTKTRTNK
jgi:hypothetical protein